MIFITNNVDHAHNMSTIMQTMLIRLRNYVFACVKAYIYEGVFELVYMTVYHVYMSPYHQYVYVYKCMCDCTSETYYYYNYFHYYCYFKSYD